MNKPLKIAVLVSGRGSNYEAIQQAVLSGRLNGEVVVVASNNPQAAALTKAANYQVPAHGVDHKTYPTRGAYEEALLSTLSSYTFDVVVLAGYMLQLSDTFLKKCPTPILNIHPSLLPAFPGLHAQKQALEYGVCISGCTVHYVDEGLDTGKIIAQRAVKVEKDDTVESLSQRILAEEHSLYVEVLQQFAEHAM